LFGAVVLTADRWSTFPGGARGSGKIIVEEEGLREESFAAGAGRVGSKAVS
jgi:hypothetical protein